MMGFSGPRMFSVLISQVAGLLRLGSLVAWDGTETISDERDEIQMKVDGYDTCRNRVE